MKNFIECKNGLVHAADAIGMDCTLCGMTTERTISSIAEYDPSADTDVVMAMVETNKKITCPTCAAIICHCYNLGKKAIGKVEDKYAE